MPSSPLGSTRGRTTSGLTWHLRPWITHMVGRRRACHVIITLGQHTGLDYVGRVMPSLPLDNTYDRTKSRLADHHLPWTANMSMLSSPYVRTHDRMTSRVTCSLESWAIFTVKRCRAWHAIIALGQHRWSDYVRREITSSRLVSTHGWTTSGMEWHHIRWATYKRWYNVRRVMSISPVDNIQG